MMSSEVSQLRFKLSPKFLEKYEGKQPDWGFGTLSYFTYKRCVEISTLVLTEDLTWETAGSLYKGQKLLAFSEETNENRNRNLCISEVLYNAIEDADCVEIELSNGERLISTPDHAWLARTSYGLRWVEAKDLDKHTAYLPKYLEPWDLDDTFIAGYIAGAFDSEGCISYPSQLDFAQCKNEVLEAVTSYLDDRNFDYSVYLKDKSHPNNRDCYSVRIYGIEQVLKLLGSINSQRLKKEYLSDIDQNALRLPRSNPDRLLKVVSVRPIGKRKIAVLSTSSKTHITNGFPSHNTYARQKDDGTQEEFFDTVRRCVEGSFTLQLRHCKSMRLPWDAMRAQRSAQVMFEKMWGFKFLPPGRGLWIMGTSVVEKVGSAALCNCFSGDTKILTEFGEASLSELVELPECRVFDRDGFSVIATVKSFGLQELQTIVLKPFGIRSNHRLTYEVTKDHRWLLADGSETTNLSVGDKLYANPTLKTFATETDGFAHGLIFGDGYRNNIYPNRFSIRLCDIKGKAVQTQIESSQYFRTTCYPPSYNGDPHLTFVVDNANWKELPVHKSGHYIASFIMGWVTADGHQESSGSICLDTQNSEAADWLIRNAPYAGFAVTGHSIETRDTNFGPRTNPLHRITLSTKPIHWSVESITTSGKKEEVYCAVVPTSRSFVLTSGIPTGNCGFVSTENLHKDFAEPFAWACDMLMLGVGVGFDTLGAGEVTVNVPLGPKRVYQIPDTREGWVESIRLLLASYTDENNERIEFDYSLIRPAGTPIKGFGGTASGPDPLRDGHENIRKLLDGVNRLPITAVTITDIMNYIGKFVVAGNVRRSAEIAIGNIDDTDFISMKDWKKFPNELTDRRWASNNSVFATPQSDFSKVVPGITTNGEPGLIFLDNARAYGRMIDGRRTIKDHRYDNCAGFNPCTTIDTWIMTTDGPRQVKDLIGPQTYDRKYLINARVYEGTNFYSTGLKKTFSLKTKEGYTVKLTDNHKVLTSHGWVEAGKLVPGDQIVLNNHRTFDGLAWGPLSETDSHYGYLLGHLIGDGTFNDSKAILSVWDNDGDLEVRQYIESICERLDTRTDFSGFNLVNRETSGSSTIAEYRLCCKAITDIASSYGVHQGNKEITDTIENQSSDFQRGLLAGLFDTDGSIQGDQSKGISVRLTSVNYDLLQRTQRILLRFGIVSTIYFRREEQDKVLPDGKGGYKTYPCKKLYELIIANDSLLVFRDNIPIVNRAKSEKLEKLLSNYKRKPNQSKFYCTFESLDPLGIEEVYDVTVQDVHRFDGNGLMLHNCAEQSLYSYELCNLVETFPGNHATAEEFHETLKYAYLYAKSVTLLPSHCERTNQVMLQNRRIGLSQSGIQQAIKKFGLKNYLDRFCNEAYSIVSNWDQIYSRWLGIPTSIKMTTVKPSGTTSLLAGATPGVHCTHSEYYLRTIRVAADSPLLPKLEAAGYRIETSVTDVKTKVVYFPVKEKNYTKSKYEISLWEQMILVKELQAFWSDNSVSCTITFKPEEAKDIQNAVEFLAPYVKTLSFLPLDDHNYAQAPYQTITESEYIDYAGSLKELSLDEKQEIKGERFCSNDTCSL